MAKQIRRVFMHPDTIAEFEKKYGSKQKVDHGLPALLNGIQVYSSTMVEPGKIVPDPECWDRLWPMEVRVEEVMLTLDEAEKARAKLKGLEYPGHGKVCVCYCHWHGIERIYCSCFVDCCEHVGKKYISRTGEFDEVLFELCIHKDG